MENSQRREKGQGLVEYALILVLVAIVAIAILLLMGPAIGNVFSNVVAILDAVGVGGGSGPITDVSTQWSGPVVRVTVSVSDPSATVSLSVVSGSGHPSPVSQVCSGSCTFNITSPSVTGGTVRASAGGGSMTASWSSP
jgi:pilus assembly protein Flp/PilA